MIPSGGAAALDAPIGVLLRVFPAHHRPERREAGLHRQLHFPVAGFFLFLNQKIFSGAKQSTVLPDKEGKDGFDAYYQRFLRALPLEQSAAKLLSV